MSVCGSIRWVANASSLTKNEHCCGTKTYINVDIDLKYGSAWVSATGRTIASFKVGMF
jgi:hypothetical protein